MKKITFLSLIATIIFSCQQKSADERGPLEGVWERTGNIIYKNSKPVDTLPISDEMFQTKIYTKAHALWLGNNKNIDSLGNDLNPGGGIYSKRYSVINDTLTEYLTNGTDNMNNWFKSNLKMDKDGNFPISFKVVINKNSYSQIWNLDSLGNGGAELYKRVE